MGFTSWLRRVLGMQSVQTNPLAIPSIVMQLYREDLHTYYLFVLGHAVVMCSIEDADNCH